MAVPGDSEARDLFAGLVSVQAEQALLGALLLNNDVYEYVVDIVAAADFATPLHSRLYEAVGNRIASGQKVDAVVLKGVFDQDPALSGQLTGTYLARLVDSVITLVNAPDYARTIADLARRRDLVLAGQDLIAAAADLADTSRTAVNIVEDIEQRLYQIGAVAVNGGPEGIGLIAAGALRQTEAAYKAGGAAVIDTGLDDVDRIVSGMGAGDLVVLGGRPSMGKSALAGNIVFNAARQGKLSVFFSLEMTKPELAQRWLAGMTGIDTDKQRHGRLDSVDWEKILDAQSALAKLPIAIDDQPRLSVPQMRQRARRHKRRFGLDLIVVDHLQLVRQGGRVENRRLEIGDASSSLKAIAKELQVPVLLLSQLSRGVEQREDKRPSLADLRECVVADTLVNLADGRRARIADLVGTTPKVVALNGGKIVAAVASNVWRVGERETWTVRLTSGRAITATDKHRLFGAKGWVRVQDMSVGDRLAISRHIPEPEVPTVWPDAHCILLGHLIGDGSFLSGQPMRYTTASMDCSDAVRAAAETFGCTVTRYEGRGNWHQLLISGNGNRWTPAGVNKWLREIGIFGQRSADKRIPESMFALSNQQAALLLRHLWATDGHISGGNVAKNMGPSAYFATCSHGLALDVAALLSRFGIIARISKVHAVYGVWVKGVENLTIFLDKVGAFGPRVTQANALRERLIGRSSNTNVDTLPIEIFATIKAEMQKQGITQRSMASMRGTSYGGTSHFSFAPSREQVLSYAALLKDDALLAEATNDIFWDSISSIEPGGRQPVYDLTVPGPHSWLADGIASHNSGDIEQDADVVMFLYRDEYYLEKVKITKLAREKGDTFAMRQADHDDALRAAQGIAEILIPKNRHGRTGVAKVAWSGERQRFDNLARTF